MTAGTTRNPAPRFSRFTWLMETYAENFSRLSRMFQPQGLPEGRYVSRVPGGLELLVDVLAQHPYTVELRLSYRMLDDATGQPDPSAYVRLYRDARQAEVTHCYVGRHWQDVLGVHPSIKAMLNHRLRMNAFLNKWLEYLDGEGHGPHTITAVEPSEDNEVVVCA
ncbi:DUF1249 domain-containing protein [Arenimonas composti]|uniref:DUF1249 domain-containing protein n=1 Tax=Arenimonas composti TR7-09 = DSM 18010 TaxID=1121013 RepID=A0A091B626_9GAMM|nr:DUF1249 domain-containing protein [Arenimonas composti]KFN46319.1 hypothetical protein P873_02070 [Arenimonas composti TR7-09 = DSM 18010]